MVEVAVLQQSSIENQTHDTMRSPEGPDQPDAVSSPDPRDGSVTALTRSDPPAWDFRASESPDGQHVAFCRAKVGEAPAIWVMDADGKDPRRITQGIDDLGADHPRWL